MISVITPTGHRPKAFDLCKRWMLQQTTPFDEWIIVDDSGEVKFDHPKVRVLKNKSASENTQADSLRMGLSVANGDIISIVEDDDYYPPNYLERVAFTMQEHGLDILGESPATYYHIGETKWRKLKNETYACLSQTTVNKRLAKLLIGIVSADLVPIDSVLWAAVKRSLKVVTADSKQNIRSLLLDTRRVVGIKGIPGRRHSGFGWDTATKDWQSDDFQLTKLQSLIPIKDDFELYKELIAKSKTSAPFRNNSR